MFSRGLSKRTTVLPIIGRQGRRVLGSQRTTKFPSFHGGATVRTMAVGAPIGMITGNFPAYTTGSTKGSSSFSTCSEGPYQYDENAHVIGDGEAVNVRFLADDNHHDDDIESIFHAQWLWINDPTYVHASSGQRIRSPSEYYGWKLASATVIEDSSTVQQDTSSAAACTIPASPPPPAGCLLPVGSVYNDLSGGEDETTKLLCVTWEKDGEESFQSYYDLDWLQRCRYDKEALDVRVKETTVHKDIALGRNQLIKTVSFQDLQSPSTHESSLYEAMDAIVEDGAVLIKNAPSSLPSNKNESQQHTDEEAVVASLGQMLAGGSLSHGHLYGDIFHVQSMAGAHNIAYTTTPLPPHQDLGYYESKPGLQLLHCITTSGTTGGESTLIDVMAAATEFKNLAPDLFDILTTCDATFIKQRHNADMLYRSPHIDVDFSGAVVGVRWSPPFEGPLCIPPHLVQDFFVAYSAFERMLDNTLPYDPFIPSLSPSLEAELRDYAYEYTWEQQLQAGDVLIFNNQRMLHGRRGFQLMEGKDAVARHLVGCYTNMEETLNIYRLLRRRQLKDLSDSSSTKWYQRNAGNGSSGVQ